MSSRSSPRRAPLLDQLVDQRVGLARLSRSNRAQGPMPERRPLKLRDQAARLRPDVEDLGEAGADRLEPRPRVEAEHGAQDDLEGQRLEAGMQLDRCVARPALDLALGHLGDEPGERLHLLAVEGGQHQLALREVRALVEQDHRVGADDGLEDPGALTGMKDVRRRREHLLELGRVRQHHERRHAQQPDREALAVARACALEVGERAVPPRDRLDHGRRGRTGRQCGHRWLSSSGFQRKLTRVTARRVRSITESRAIQSGPCGRLSQAGSQRPYSCCSWAQQSGRSSLRSS